MAIILRSISYLPLTCFLEDQTNGLYLLIFPFGVGWNIPLPHASLWQTTVHPTNEQSSPLGTGSSPVFALVFNNHTLSHHSTLRVPTTSKAQVCHTFSSGEMCYFFPARVVTKAVPIFPKTLARGLPQKKTQRKAP